MDRKCITSREAVLSKFSFTMTVWNCIIKRRHSLPHWGITFIYYLIIGLLWIQGAKKSKILPRVWSTATSLFYWYLMCWENLGFDNKTANNKKNKNEIRNKHIHPPTLCITPTVTVFGQSVWKANQFFLVTWTTFPRRFMTLRESVWTLHACLCEATSTTLRFPFGRKLVKN